MRIALHSKQRAFIESSARLVLFVGGVRSGKTFAGVVRGIMEAARRGGLGCVVAPTFAMLRDVVVRQYLELLPDAAIEYFNASRLEMRLAGGGEILFRSAENPARLSGLTLNWFHIDEAAFLPKRVYEILLNRTISTKGCGFITTTPMGRNWIWDLYRASIDDPDIFVVQAFTADNPSIDPNEVERASRLLDPRFFRQQYYASFESFEGQVYDDFDPTVHILPDGAEPFSDGVWYVGIDFGWSHETAVLWGQLDRKGRWFIWRELVARHLKPDILADALKGKPIELHGRVFRAPISYRMIRQILAGAEGLQSRQEAGGLSHRDILHRNGIGRVRFVAEPVIRGVWAIRAKLLSADGHAALFIHPSCERTISDIQGYHFSDSKPEQPAKDGITDHTMDALRYLVSGITPIRKREWRI